MATPERRFRESKPATAASSATPSPAGAAGGERYQGDPGAPLPRIEPVDGRIKINPLADWPAAEIRAAFQDLVPQQHPLAAKGYPSIGVAPCPKPALPGSALRCGRWEGSGKVECGIHRSQEADC